MSEYELYVKFYRLLREGCDHVTLRKSATVFHVERIYLRALRSLYARDWKPTPITERLGRYKMRKHANRNLAYAA